MPSYAVVYVFVSALVTSACAVQLTAFETAAASSVHVGTSNSFAASQAVAAGSGYWCSTGGHGAAQAVTWTGVLSASRRAAGVALHWAYSPREVQVLVSSDGLNFAEAACWRETTQENAAYIEYVMFEQPSPTRSVTVVMRGVRAWGYFGLHSAALLVEPGPLMLVSGSTRTAGEVCAVAAGGTVAVSSCINALASGAGQEAFRWTDAGLLQSVTHGRCLSLSSGGSGAGGELITAPCQDVAAADDGPGLFQLTDAGQLRVGNGNVCAVAEGARFSVQDCDQASGLEDASDKFIAVAIPSFSPSAAAAAHSAADLALKTAARVTRIIGELQHVLSSHSGCLAQQGLRLTQTDAFGNSTVSSRLATAVSLAAADSLVGSSLSAKEEFAAAVASELRVSGLLRIVADARAFLATVRKQL